MTSSDVLILGAGVGGLGCARALADAGVSVRLLEKSRGVGGRCATRRLDGQSVDHGLAFYHGNDPTFLSALRVAGHETILEGWPERIEGAGHPCHPRAFRDREWRLAFRAGVTVFPKSLAAGLDVRLGTPVRSLEVAPDRWTARTDGGETHDAATVIVTIPAPQAQRLLADLDTSLEGLATMRQLLRGISFSPSLTVIAVYGRRARRPEWQMAYPENSSILQLISHDSSKRAEPARPALVLQALPSWSRVQGETPDAEWSALMIAEAARLFGPWIARPDRIETHHWRLARVGGGSELARPFLARLPGGLRIAFVGDALRPGGGVQAAWQSGRELARRLIEED